MESYKRKLKKLLSPSYFIDRLFIFIMEKKEKEEGYFYTLHKRPKISKDLIPSCEKYTILENIAIVIQGPLALKENFTLETILLYKKYFPETTLILSTWAGEDKPTIEKIKEIGCIVIQNEKPLFNGYWNINYQITSSKNGIEKAKELGIEYVLKTRTDQRMYNPNSLQLFLQFNNLYPPNKDSQQKKRLLVPNFGTLKYRPYGVGDMIMFGHIEDMIIYWNTEHDSRVIKFEEPHSILELAKIRTTEVYLATEYLKKMGHTLKWTLEDTWKIYGKYFCIFDHSLLDMFWYKDFEIHKEFRFHYYEKINSYELMNYTEWLTCFNNTLKTDTLPEDIIQKKEGDNL